MQNTLTAIVQRKHERWEKPINGHEVSYHYTYDPVRDSHIIVAKIADNCVDDVLDGFEFDSDNPFMACSSFKMLRKCKMSEHPTARASCEPRDTFDETFGRNLAHDRLEVAYWSQYENRLGKLNEVLMELFELNSEKMTKISEAHLQRED